MAQVIVNPVTNDITVIVGSTTPENPPVVDVSGSKTLALSDARSFQNVTATATITIPKNSDVAFPIATQIDFFQSSSGTITFSAPEGVTIVSRMGTVSTATQGDAATLKKTGTDTWALIIG